MGRVANARAMPSSWQIKRGLGLLLVAVVGWVIAAAVLAATDPADAASPAVEWIGLVVGLLASFVVVGCLVSGVVLLLWGLFSD